MNLKAKYIRFRQWQQQPHIVAEMAEEEHTCPTCSTVFRGNYCPRCGQSRKIGRYSIKGAMLLFIDIWGVGNRGMFRSLRDLILRPGYMIRDYLMGMQMAYFPPFKMMFLLTALWLLVASGWNINGVDTLSGQQTSIDQAVQKPIIELRDKTLQDNDPSEKQKKEVIKQKVNDRTNLIFKYISDLYDRNTSIFQLCMLMLTSVFLFIFFRKSPAIPDLRYSELLVALVYTSNMQWVYSIVCEFFCLPDKVETATYIMTFIALKQFSGFSWWRTVLYTLFAFVMLFASIVLVIVIYGITMAIYLRNTLDI